jgi:hypothetical protein
MTFDDVARAAELAALLTAAEVKAYHDPADAVNNRPCLLIGVPTIDHTEGSWESPQVTWPIFALSSYEAFTLDARKEMQPLRAAARGVLDVERETPARYTLAPDGKQPIAAYQLTHTEIP